MRKTKQNLRETTCELLLIYAAIRRKIVAQQMIYIAVQSGVQNPTSNPKPPPFDLTNLIGCSLGVCQIDRRPAGRSQKLLFCARSECGKSVNQSWCLRTGVFGAPPKTEPRPRAFSPQTCFFWPDRDDTRTAFDTICCNWHGKFECRSCDLFRILCFGFGVC